MDTGYYRMYSRFPPKLSTQERVKWARELYANEFGREPVRCLLNKRRAADLEPDAFGMEIVAYACILDDEVRLLVQETA